VTAKLSAVPGRKAPRFFVPAGALRIWFLSGLLATIALALFLGVVRHITPSLAPVYIPWWALAIGFYLAETNVVHLEFRRQAHTFSLSEIPLVIGLVFATPTDFVIAHMIGAGLGLVVRRQPAIKLAFNLSHFALEATLAVTVFNLLANGELYPGVSVWMAAFAATIVVNVVGIMSIAIAIAFAEGRWHADRLPEVLKLGLAVGLTNTSLALMGVTILWLQPTAAWLLGIPIALILLAYRTLMSEREKNKSLEFLYESTRILQRSPELDEAVSDLLQHARTMFRAGRARLVLFPTRPGEMALETVIGPGEDRQVMREIPFDIEDPLYRRALAENHAYLYERANSHSDEIEQRYPDMQDAMVAMLRGDTAQAIGMLVIGDRLGDVTSFVAEDLKLFETLANHAAVAFENGQLGRALAQLAELKERLRHQAYHDVLTGLGNRALFLERLNEALAAELRTGKTGPAILFVDLDDFKTVNDSLGHAAGDELLRAVADRLTSCLRPTDIAVRLGGDEFGVIIAEGDMGVAVAIAERILEAFRAPFDLNGTEVGIHGSIGIAVSRRPNEGAEALVRDADVAMYTAKASGKGNFAVFQPQFYAAVVQRHALKGDLQRAVDDKRFVLHYQPITDLTTGEITAVEALIRWRHPARGLVLPAEFIPFAEETGLILPIGRWVLEQAMEQVHTWRESTGLEFPRLSVNVSARQVQQPNFVDEIAELVLRSGLPASRLTLEITETLMMQNAELTIARLQAVRALGINVALDDFGTGWSSMAWLRELPVDAIKIPKEFLGGLGASENDWEFARAIVTLGHSLRLGVIAEGIEYADQVERLRAIGVDSGQGFYFSPPVEAASIPALLEAPVQLPEGPASARRATASRRSKTAIFPLPAGLQLAPATDRPH